MSIGTVKEAIAILKDRIPKALYALEVPSRNPYDAYPELKDAEIALAALDSLAMEPSKDALAARNHAEVLYKRLVAAQDALITYPVIVTRLVRGYGVDVNERQIEAWLRDAIGSDAEKEMEARDERIRRECAERAVSWYCGPRVGNMADLRAAIMGEAKK